MEEDTWLWPRSSHTWYRCTYTLTSANQCTDAPLHMQTCICMCKHAYTQTHTQYIYTSLQKKRMIVPYDKHCAVPQLVPSAIVTLLYSNSQSYFDPLLFIKHHQMKLLIKQAMTSGQLTCNLAEQLSNHLTVRISSHWPLFPRMPSALPCQQSYPYALHLSSYISMGPSLHCSVWHPEFHISSSRVSLSRNYSVL